MPGNFFTVHMLFLCRELPMIQHGFRAVTPLSGNVGGGDQCPQPAYEKSLRRIGRPTEPLAIFFVEKRHVFPLTGVEDQSTRLKKKRKRKPKQHSSVYLDLEAEGLDADMGQRGDSDCSGNSLGGFIGDAPQPRAEHYRSVERKHQKRHSHADMDQSNDSDCSGNSLDGFIDDGPQPRAEHCRLRACRLALVGGEAGAGDGTPAL